LKIALAQTNENELTLRYAIKIRDAVQQSGIATELGYTIPDDSRERGVIIALRNPSQMAAEAQQIQKAFEKAGVPTTVAPFTRDGMHIPGDTGIVWDYVIWIAPKRD
jgi:hypothetical protein